MKTIPAILLAALAPALCAADGAKRVITSVEEVAEVCRTSVGTDATFDVEGKLWLYYNGVHNGKWTFFIPLPDGSNTVKIYEMPTAKNSFGDSINPHLNDTFRFRGRFHKRKGAYHAEYDSAELVRRGSIGPEDEITPDELMSPSPRRGPVRLMGFVRDASRDETDPNFLYLTINSSRSLVHVMVNTFGITHGIAYFDPASVIGRNVAVDGLVHDPTDGLHRYSGRILFVSGLENVHVEPSKAEPDGAIPDISAIRDMTPHAIATLGRHRAVGTVRAAWRGNRALVETDAGEVVGARFLGMDAPAHGLRVSVIGFPETDTFMLSLDNAVWSPADGEALPEREPIESGIDALSKNPYGTPHVNIRANGRTVRFKGIVRYRMDAARQCMLFVESEGHLVTVDLSACQPPPDDIEIGSEVSVAGTYVVNAERMDTGDSVPKAHGFFIVPRRSTDIAVLSRPPWWTPGRLLAVICLLVMLAAAIAFWNVSLARRAERRGRELADERMVRMASELKTAERTHLAVELHDALSQTLSGVSLAVDAAADDLAAGELGNLGRYITFASNAIDGCRTELKNCLWDLRNAALDEEDMEEALRMTLQQNIADGRIAVRFAVPRDRLTDTTAHDILRTVRELVANAIRHGRARKVAVAGCMDDGKVVFSVSDDGCGFNPEECPGVAQGHFGLQGIRERLRRCNGEMRIESAPGKGTKVTIRMEADA
ncbi:MAG: ATP-binding protein [Kiritimatiellae bacterium]|nr:ATP-binding protein [Kiritimatiellia bacterium]